MVLIHKITRIIFGNVNYSISVCTNILTSSSGTFQSPGYPSPGYGDNLNLCWLVDTQNYFGLSFPYVWVETDYDFVRVYDGDSTSAPLMYTMTNGPYNNYYKTFLVPSSKQALVVFTSDSSSPLPGFNLPGFEAKYAPCSVLTSAGGGTISSSNYPNNYDDLENSCWLIDLPAGYVATLSFNSLNIEFNFDYVRVFDGPSTSSPALLVTTGSQLPGDVTSSTNQMLVTFSSDHTNNFSGFQATFNAVLAG